MEKEDYIVDLPTTFGENFKIGVVLSYDVKNDQPHCGIAFDFDGLQCVIHLATHKRLKYEENLREFKCIIKPNLHKVQQESLSALCEVLKDDIRNRKILIPYGFLYDNYALIQPDGTLQLTENEIGLTCATFVLTFFHSCGIDLVDLNDWPPREEDQVWFLHIINELKKYAQLIGIEQSHLDKMKSQKGVSRFRPEEVAVSSALYEGRPAPTFQIWEKGKKLKMYLVASSQKEVSTKITTS